MRATNGEMSFLAAETKVWKPDFQAPGHSATVDMNIRTPYYPTRRAPGVFSPDILGAGFDYTMLPVSDKPAPINNPLTFVEQPRGDARYYPTNRGYGHSTPDDAPIAPDQPVVTLVRYRPQDDPMAIPLTPTVQRCAVIYIHGWNDYFFQRELARHYALAGGAFYALDLRHYGRSSIPGVISGWTSDIREYGADISAAINFIRTAHPGLPIVLQGHSTGGLIAALWAHAHPGQISALVLNSPWLEFQMGVKARYAIKALMRILSPFPLAKVTPEAATTGYGKTFNGWDIDIDGELPAELQPWTDDPSVSGWPIIMAWKQPEGRYTRAGWLDAILDGHQRIARGLHIDCPILCQVSDNSVSTVRRDTESLYADAVLDAGLLEMRAEMLGDNVTVLPLRTRHDVLMGFPATRQKFFFCLHEWLDTVLPSNSAGIHGTHDAPRINEHRIPDDAQAKRVGNLPVFSAGSICP